MKTIFVLPVAFPLLAWGFVACGGSSSNPVATGGDGGASSSSGGSTASSSGGSGASSSSGGDDGGPASEDGGVTAAQACTDIATARCKQWDACSNSTYVNLHYGSQAACIAAGSQSCALGLAAPGTATTPASVEGCAQATATETCADLFGTIVPAACATLAGTGAMGAACFASAQCASTYCDVPSFASCGTCAAVPVAGAACGVDENCGARGGLVCSDLGTCVALGALSSACDKDDPCGPDLSCVGANAKKAVKGTCEAAVGTAGAACDADQATGPGCDATLGLKCDAATSKCVQDSLVAASATCGDLGAGVVGKCEANGTCDVPTVDAGTAVDGGDAGPAAPVTGTCLAASPLGSPCDSANGPSCVLPNKCVSADGGTAGVCAIVNPTTCP